MRTLLDQQQKETHQLRGELFDKGQQLDQEKRLVAEKALALEEYSQQVFFRANDPAAQHRVERMRRRWLAQNAAVVRAAKKEGEAARQALEELETSQTELLQQMSELAHNDAALAEKQSLLDEREATLKAQQLQLDHELEHIRQRQPEALRIQDEIDIIASAMYVDDDEPPIDKAA